MKKIVTFSILQVIIFIGYAQFEQRNMRNTSNELDIKLHQDSVFDYIKIFLTGDLTFHQDLEAKAVSEDGNSRFRQWFRMLKPLFHNADILVGSTSSTFPGKKYAYKSFYGAPDEFLGELDYCGFDVLMLSSALKHEPEKEILKRSADKLDILNRHRVGFYFDSIDKRINYPLVLEKKGIRVAFLSYTTHKHAKSLTNSMANPYDLKQIEKDIQKAKTMLSDYLITYIDWESVLENERLEIAVELFNLGVDVLVGTGAEAFTKADLLDLDEGNKKIFIEQIGQLNASKNERSLNKSSIIEIVLKKDKVSKKINLHDMGFIPVWTLIDHKNYAVLPINNVDERHIKDIQPNYLQYGDMKTALTDLRYAFFNKLEELHYNFTDNAVDAVEFSSFMRKTIVAEQEKSNKILIAEAHENFKDFFGQSPKTQPYEIAYDDDLAVYAPANSYSVKRDDKSGRILKKFDDGYETKDLVCIDPRAQTFTKERKKRIILTPEEQRVKDSIDEYMRRFYVEDTFATIKAMLKKAKMDSARKKDSIFMARMANINKFDKKIDTRFEGKTIANNPKMKIKQGVFHETDAEGDDNNENTPYREIDEFFLIEVFRSKHLKEINITALPYMKNYEVFYENDEYVYYIGRTRSLNFAISMCKSVRQKGAREAKIIKQTNGVRSLFMEDIK
ncbi:MAG: CapA family protein [Chitinophagales bacterium]|jgi:poly-gamma-glutamate synthesis protein (capsule biosynthesis protein)|nr:CapA family protein [Chitinophagales bacterium]